MITLGTIVVTRVQNWMYRWPFLITFLVCSIEAGGTWDGWWIMGLHSASTGSLLLFFFMISDPRTAPNHPGHVLTWAIAIAMVAFYLATFKWMYNTPILVWLRPVPWYPLLDWLFPRPRLSMESTGLSPRCEKARQTHTLYKTIHA